MPARHALIATLALLAPPAFAQPHEGHGTMAPYMATMEPMMEAMDGMASSDDADADFLLMMIPHHQSAIDMARVALEHGDDPATQELARKIIDAQEDEIAEMKAMLVRLGVEVPD